MTPWIGFAGGIIATAVSLFVALRQTRMAKELAQINSDLAAEVHRRTALIDRELDAETVLTRYREPLAAAAFDLQSRLYNILKLGFMKNYGGDHPRAEDAVRTTLFRFAQYFGWTEILRRDIQFLSFPEAHETQRVAELRRTISQAFLAVEYGPALMIWSDEQRAIGERMIVEKPDKLLCMGYAAFQDACGNAFFAPLLERLRDELEEDAAQERLRDVQHALCDLVETLDPGRLRYSPDVLERA